MSWQSLKAFKVKGYKCFSTKNEYQGFDELKAINILIGKNNSGKTKVLECLLSFIAKSSKSNLWQNREVDFSIHGKIFLTEGALKAELRLNASGGLYDYLVQGNSSHWNGVGKHLVGKIFSFSEDGCEIEDHGLILPNANAQKAYDGLVLNLRKQVQNPFQGYGCLSIQSERDIRREGVSFQDNEVYHVRPNGEYITQLIVSCLKEERGHSHGWQKLVEKELLDNINSVLAPDIHLTRIDAKIANTQWEIYLEEAQKGSMKLSDCGSGIKTVIFVMVLLYLSPLFMKKDKFVFCFEELENNLHPSLERRLLAYIRDYMYEHPDSILFLTTHSSVAIDMFSRDDKAQILRAYNDGEATFISTVKQWKDHHNLLDDLGVKASDVLQSNCVVWLEGPSDRIYFNKWMEIFNDGKELEEGVHYQCVFYGGAILAHYTANAEEQAEFIQMLKVNRNAVVMMDSDKSDSMKPLKPNIQRVLQEAKKSDILTWVTEGREVENYLPACVLEDFFDCTARLGRFDVFKKKYENLSGRKVFDKVKFATQIINAASYNRTNLEEHLGLGHKMSEVIDYIRKCNT